MFLIFSGYHYRTNHARQKQNSNDLKRKYKLILASSDKGMTDFLCRKLYALRYRIYDETVSNYEEQYKPAMVVSSTQNSFERLMWYFMLRSDFVRSIENTYRTTIPPA